MEQVELIKELSYLINMPYQIDQSGKVKDTNKLTIVAFANDKVKSLKISGIEKQKLVKIMRIRDYPKKTFIFKIFAALVFLLLKDEKIEKIIIDKEYPGHEAIIKDILSHLFKKKNRQIPEIMFGKIGKKSAAHKATLEVFRGKRKPDIIIKADYVIQLLY